MPLIKNTQEDLRRPRLLLLTIILWSINSLLSQAWAQATVPNSARGEQPGTLLAGPVDPDMGRLANIQFLGGHIITIPETPGSEPNDHQRTQAWDISTPQNPNKITPTNPDSNFGDFGRTGNPVLAHGTYSRGNEVFIGSNGDNASFFDTVRLNDDGSLSHTQWSGPTSPELFNRVPGQPGVAGAAFNPRRFANWFSKGAMMQPWAINDNWSYNSPTPLSTLTLRNILMAQWNITAETGASGFGNFFGNLLIYVSDQLRGGVAIYDATDIRVGADGVSRPFLLDTFNTPSSEGGVGGYWSEISGHYIVIGRETVGGDANSFDGIQVINFEDPTDIKLQCQTELVNPNANQSFALESRPRYPGLQDEFAFVDNFKVNIETCDVVAVLDVSDGQTTDNLCRPPVTNCPRRLVDTGEYNRVIGNLVVSGGFPVQPNIDGMSIWVHQQAADTRPPFIAHQIPQPDQINYPINAPLGFSIPETLRSETIVTSENRRAGQTDSVTITEVDSNGNLLNNGLVATDYVLSHQGMLTLNPVNLLKANTTYEVNFTNEIQDAVGNRLQATSFRFATGNSVSGSNVDIPATISRIDVSPSNNIEVGSSVTITVSSPNAASYQIAQEGNSAPFTNQASRSFNFTTSGTFSINVRARNDDGDSSLQRVSIQVREPGVPQAPGRNSSQLTCDADNNSVWAVNPDNHTVTVLNTRNLDTRDELSGVTNPQSAALVNGASSGDEVWVSSKEDDRIVVFDANSRVQKRIINTGYGSGPAHLLASNNGEFVYVTFFSSGKVARYATSDNSNTPDIIDLAATANAMALTPDGSRLLITRLISPENWGEVYSVDTQNWQLQRTFILDKHLVDDSLNEGRGKPNYLTSIVVNGSGNRAYVVGKKDNTDRGVLNAGINNDLDPDNTVRTIGMVLDLDRNVELKNQRRDFDNTSSLSALAMSTDDQILFIAEQGRNAVRAIPVDENLILNGQTRTFATGLAPQGLCFDNQRKKLFTKNFTDRTVTAIDISNGLTNASQQTVSTVANETLSDSELRGLQLFYNAFEGLTASSPVGRVSAEGYISCASCHLDGGEDGNTWDFTGRGEGLRNNISLRGRSGLRFGNVHWTANFDEIQDFEHDIRGPFGGRGFLTGSQFSATNAPLGTPKAGLSDALDNLSAYVSSLGRQSLPRSDNRNTNGSIAGNARSGRTAFQNQGCINCHSGSAFTDRQLHDVGTLRASSGQRLGGQLTAIKTPSLLGLFDTPPYLHDGSAKTINDVFNTVGGQIWDLAIDNFEFNGVPVTQSNSSYLRNGRAIRLEGDDALTGRFARFTNGVPGQAKLRVRYGSALDLNGGQLIVSIADEVQGTINLERLPQVDGQDVLFTESTSIDFTVPDGDDGFIIMLRYRGNSSVIIDEITVSNANDIAKAEPHLRAASLSTSVTNSLVNYVRSIDRRSAPADSDTNIFDNPPLPPTAPTTPSNGEELCFPIKIRDTERYAVICL